ncbi:MAG: polyphosphate kinase 2 family protein [Bacteroidetes bacterium]|nr:polyphosphate kinase 2 family protein [Bacteroidota bacterium]
MNITDFIKLNKFTAKEGKSISLKKFPTHYKGKAIDKEESEELLKQSLDRLSESQDKLYSKNQYSLLIILQAMDAAGKDGVVKHITTGLNPVGVKITSFKAPTTAELEHDYLWRHCLALPSRGDIGIFNRSHYENVITTKVHPEYLLSQQLPHIHSVKDIDDAFWQKRYREIRNFERTIAENGTVILKFFLHVSKEEQKKRLLERIDNPKKNWKFSSGDITERGFWQQYHKAYEAAISNTSTEYAPWFIVPADDKWFTRLMVSETINLTLDKLKLTYPTVEGVQKASLQKAKKILLAEE